jgi:hypothetical protein
LPFAGLAVSFEGTFDMKHNRGRRRRRRLEHKDYTNTCAWCLHRIPEEHERFGFGAKAAPGVDLSGVEGTMIEIQLVSAGKAVPAGVTGSDSPARKQEGFHFYFMTCSEDCCRQLQAAVSEDIQLGRSLGLNQ